MTEYWLLHITHSQRYSGPYPIPAVRSYNTCKSGKNFMPLHVVQALCHAYVIPCVTGSLQQHHVTHECGIQSNLTVTAPSIIQCWSAYMCTMCLSTYQAFIACGQQHLAKLSDSAGQSRLAVVSRSCIDNRAFRVEGVKHMTHTLSTRTLKGVQKSTCPIQTP